MAWRGSFSRTLMSSARSSSFRSSSPSLPRLRPPSLSAPRVQSRRISFTNPRNLGELGCAQSLLPLLAGARLTSHLTVSARACCELSHERFCQSVYLRHCLEYSHLKKLKASMSMIGEEKKIAFGTIFAFGSGKLELGRQVVDHMASRISINSVLERAI